MKKLLLLSIIACATMFIGCKPKSSTPELSHSSLSLKSLETAQLKIEGGDNDVRWVSDNDFVATVDQKGLVKALTIGETQITAKFLAGDVLTCKITVNPLYELYDEPIKDFGASVSQIKSKEKRKLSKGDDESLIYLDPNAKQILYLFENNKMTSCAGVFSLQSDAKQITGFLKERYIYVGEKDKAFFFESKDTFVGLTVETYGVVIMYVKNSDKSNNFVKSHIANSNNLDIDESINHRNQIRIFLNSK